MSEIPRILLLGDSIRMSYQPLVAEILDGKAEVVGPAENCQYSLFTLSSLDRWIGELGQFDVVHWNNGLHDCGHNPNRSPVQIPIDMYRANLGFILKRLKSLTPNVIWASNTPVHPERTFRDTEPVLFMARTPRVPTRGLETGAAWSRDVGCLKRRAQHVGVARWHASVPSPGSRLSVDS